MFTIIDNKVYLIQDNKMFPVNVSLEKGVEKVGKEEKLPADYPIYTLREIQIKFGINKENPFYFDKEKYEKDLEEKTAKEEAEKRAEIEKEIREEIAKEEEMKKAQGKLQGETDKTKENK